MGIGWRTGDYTLSSIRMPLPCAENKPVVTLDAFRPIELSLGLPMKAGFSPERAVFAHWALVGYTLGHVSFQVNNPIADPAVSEEQTRLRRENLPPEEFPHLLAALPSRSDVISTPPSSLASKRSSKG